MTTTTTTAERSPLDLALDAIPNYRETEAAIERLRAHRPTTPSARADDLIAEVVAATLDGKPVPADTGQRAADAKRAAEFVAAEQVIIAEVRMRLDDKLNEALRNGSDDGVRALRGPFEELLAEVRTLASALNGVSDAAQAIKAGPEAAAAWAQLEQLADRHDELRTVQHSMLVAAAGEGGFVELAKYRNGYTGGSVLRQVVIDAAGWLENVDETWPQWLDATRGRPDPTGMAIKSRPPWPHTEDHPLQPAHGSPDFLLWLATTTTGRPWVASLSQAARAYCDQSEEVARREDEAREIATYGRVRSPSQRRNAAARKFAQDERQFADAKARAAYGL